MRLLKEGEEVTLLRWGNFFVDTITTDAATGQIVSATGRYHPAAVNFSKTKKLSWLSAVPDIVPLTLVEFDHLIAKVYSFLHLYIHRFDKRINDSPCLSFSCLDYSINWPTRKISKIS